MNRRDLLKSAAAGALGLWGSRRAFAWQWQRLSDRFEVRESGGNEMAFNSGDGVVFVDCGAPGGTGASSNTRLLFNTHYHLDQTGNNEAFGTAGAGAKII